MSERETNLAPEAGAFVTWQRMTDLSIAITDRDLGELEGRFNKLIVALHQRGIDLAAVFPEVLEPPAS